MRRFGFAAPLATTLAAAFLVLAAPRALAAEPREVEPPEEPEWARGIERKLQRKVSFEFVDTPLTEAIAFLQTLTKVNMIVNPTAVAAAGTKAITLKVTNERLGAALLRLCTLAGFEYALVNGVIYVATREDMEDLEEGRRQEAEARREAARLPDGVWEVEIRRKFARKVTFEFVDTPLSEALQFLQTLTETTIIVDPVAFKGKETAPIMLKVTRMQLAFALQWILKLADLDYGLVDGAVFVSTPKRIASARRALHAKRFAEALRPDAEWRRAIRRKLDRRASFEFAETPFSEAIAFLQTLTRMNMILDPRAGAAERPVTLKVTNMPLDAAFRWMCRIAACDYALVDEAVFISTPERTAMELLYSAERRAAEAARAEDAIPEWERALRAKLARKVTFEFIKTPLGEVARFFGTLTETEIDLAPAAEAARATPITLKVTNMPFADALRWTCRLAGLDYVLADGAIRVGRAEEPEWRREAMRRLARRVTLTIDERAIDCMGFIQALCDVDFVLDPAAFAPGAKQVTAQLEELTLTKTLGRILAPCGLAHAMINEAVFVSTSERIVEVAQLEAARLEREAAREGPLEWWQPGLKRALETRKQHDLRDMALGEALGVLAKASGFPIVLDPEVADDIVARPVSLSVLYGMRAGAALRWLCRLAGADHRLTEKGILVSTPQTLRRREIDAALAKRIPFEFRDVHYADVIEQVGVKAGVPVSLDPGLHEDLGAITFTGADMTARATLDRLARLGRLEWAVRDGAVFVSTPAVISGKREAEPQRAVPPPEEAMDATDAPLADEDDVF